MKNNTQIDSDRVAIIETSCGAKITIGPNAIGRWARQGADGELLLSDLCFVCPAQAYCPKLKGLKYVLESGESVDNKLRYVFKEMTEPKMHRLSKISTTVALKTDSNRTEEK